jgi:hypothetical protein
MDSRTRMTHMLEHPARVRKTQSRYINIECKETVCRRDATENRSLLLAVSMLI